MTPQQIAEALTAMRRRESYHLACIWLERLVDANPRAVTKTARCPVFAVCLLLGDFIGTKFCADTMSVALADTGFVVAQRRGMHGMTVRTNLRESVLWDLARQRHRADYTPRSLAHLGDGPVIATPNRLH